MPVLPTLRRLLPACLLLISGLSVAQWAAATVVEFQTSLGSFQVNLYDIDTPATVENFLSYVEDGDYTNSIIHRSMPDFVVQGGGYVVPVGTDNPTIPPRTTVPPGTPTPAPEQVRVPNEPIYSNVPRTIAMAKLSGNTVESANSATNQWFFNLVDNSDNLDSQNGGFTVFGQVIDDGFAVVQAIEALRTYPITITQTENIGGTDVERSYVFSDLPLLSTYTETDFDNEVTPDATHFVVINAIIVVDPTIDTASGLDRPLNTTPAPVPTSNSSGGGSGSIGIFALAALLLLSGLRKRLLQ